MKFSISFCSKEFDNSLNFLIILGKSLWLIGFLCDPKLNQSFSTFAKKNGLIYVSPMKVLCKENYTCLTKIYNQADSIVNWDENHFTEKASIFIFSKFID